MKNIIKSFTFFSVILVMISCTGIKIWAAEICTNEFDCEQQGTITFDYSYDDAVLDAVEFRVYQITTLDEDGNHVLLDNSLDICVECDSLSDTNYCIQLRDNLDNYINYEMIEPIQVFFTDEEGQYELGNLELGLYFIQAEVIEENNQVIYSDSILLTVGSYDTAADEWIYQYDVEPKISVINDEWYNLTITKIWENTNSDEVIPPEIEVGVYCEGLLYDIITLSEENMWTYTFYGVEPSMNWGIKELTEFEDFEVNYTKDLLTFTLTNTYVGELDEELPQTGSYAYMISGFSGLGLIFLLLGILLKCQFKREDGEYDENYEKEIK